MYRLKSPNLKYQLELTRYIAFALAKRQNKNNKNIFRNSENRIDFTGLDIDSLYALLSFGLSLNEARDYREILSILKSMPNNENYPIEATSVHLAKLQDKNGKNIFRDDENKINFDELDISFLARFAIEIAPCSIYYSKINLQDYKEILSTLMSMQNYQHYYIERIAFFLSLLQDENSKNFFRDKNGQLDFNNLDIASLEIIAKFNLTPTQYDDYIEILSILSSMSNKEDYHTKNIAAGLAKLQDENGKNIFKNKNGEFDFHNLDFYSLEEISHQKLTQKQCQNYRYLATTMGIKPEYAVHIAKNEYLMQRFELIDPDIFWKGATGEAKSLFELMEHCLKIGELNGEKISSSDFDSNILENGNEFNDGTLTYSTEDESKNYSVELEKISHNNTPVLIVKNKSGQRESYIAYDGAIALVRPLSYLENDKLDNLKQSLSSHAHFSIEEINALTKSAIHFIVDIIEENGECIISKGIDGIEHAKPFDGKKLNTVETKNKFDNVLKKLHKDKNIKVEDIFRLMPKDAVIQIRPYATSSSSHPILYSLSAEWKDSNGTAWELRAHSDDLNHPNDEHNWVYRLGYKEENQEPRFYCVEKDADGNFIDSKFVVEDRNVDEDIMYKTHVQFDMEPEKFKENLISNPYFQSTIRNISISHNNTQEIQKIATELKVVREGEKVEETKNRIIQKCQQNAGYYLKYKKVVDCLLNEKGLPPLSRAG